MMFADGKRVDADLLCQDCFADDVSKRLRFRQERAVGIDGHVAEGIQPELEGVEHDDQCWLRYHSRQLRASRGSVCPVMSRSAWNTQPCVC